MLSSLYKIPGALRLVLLVLLIVLPVRAQVVRTRDIQPIQVSPRTETRTVTIELADYFDYEGLSGGTLVQLFSNLGAINLELLDEVAPNTVENFLFYVNEGRYDNSFIHRRSTLQTSGLEVMQGGGFAVVETDEGPDIVPVETRDPIVNEYNPDYPNVRYSMSMAKLGGDPDSATSQWFINLDDNSEVLNESNNGGFTVFANVIGAGTATIDAIGGLQIVNAGSPFGELPVVNLENNTVTFNDLVYILEADVMSRQPTESQIGLISYVVAGNTNSSLITTELVGSTLFLTVAGDSRGTATLSVLVAEAGFESTLGEVHDFVIRVRSGLEHNSEFIGSDWRFSNWLGLAYFQPGTSWVFHPELGWFYVYDSDQPAGHFFFLPGVGWTWTDAAAFPALWSFNANAGAGGWLTWDRGSSNPRWFYDHTAGEWVSFD